MKYTNVMLMIVAILASMLLTRAPALSQGNFWSRVDSFSVKDFAFHPNDNSVLFSGSNRMIVIK